MTDSLNPIHHQHIRKRIYKKHEPFPHPDKYKQFLDNLIYIIAIISPIMNLPQLFKIWAEKDASSISLTSWFSFALFSFVWFLYGLAHKEKPIIFMNFFLFLVQMLIVISILIYS